MREHEYIDRLQSYLREYQHGCKDAVWLVEEALQAYPGSARICLLHGLVLLASLEEDSELEANAVRSMEKAIQIDPSFADAYEHLGHYYDGIKDNPEKAMQFYRRAAQLRGEQDLSGSTNIV